MIIDRETFTEMAVELKLASDSVLIMARCLAILSARHEDPMLDQVVEALMAVNENVGKVEGLFRATVSANRDEDALKKREDPKPH